MHKKLNILKSEDEDEEKSALEIRRALQEGILSIWPDEDTRQFYEMRLQLREMVPAILFQVLCYF